MAGYAYIALRHIPKSERFTLGAEIRSGLWKGLRLIVRANAAKSKLPLLYELDAEIQGLLALIRVARDLKIMPYKKYEILSGKLVELGKMLGGWIKYSRT
ncbi:MAG: diversity-generating retroelement protein Avd [Deltaproteobacteria bacterium]|nr:diversity-generating retroelement protein Avd [Deltaproteobacteria bacterium]